MFAFTENSAVDRLLQEGALGRGEAPIQRGFFRITICPVVEALQLPTQESKLRGAVPQSLWVISGCMYWRLSLAVVLVGWEKGYRLCVGLLDGSNDNERSLVVPRSRLFYPIVSLSGRAGQGLDGSLYS